MSTVEDKAGESVDPPDLTHEIEVRRRIEQGLQDIAEGRVTTHEEVRRRFLGG